jgi:mannosyltransferase OCH1-like enzyme
MIPKIIHQVWYNDNPDIPLKYQESHNEWKRLHPDYKYILWNRQNGDELVRTYEPEFYNTYKNYPYEIQRIDSIRYVFLKWYGGIYSDLDLVPLYNLNDEFQKCGQLFFVQSNLNKNSYNNSLFGGEKGLRVWNDLIEQCKKKKKPYYIGKHFTVMYTTGPSMLTKYLKNSSNEIFSILPFEVFNPEYGMSYKMSKMRALKGNSWSGMDTRIYSIIKYPGVIIIFILLVLILIILLIK